MKKPVLFLTFVLCALWGCDNPQKSASGFVVSGEIKNIADQKIVLEEVYFSSKRPSVIDTANLVSGKFTIEATAPEEGLYRLRLEAGPSYIFINDKKNIPVTIDASGADFSAVNFNSPANKSLKKFIVILDSLQTKFDKLSDSLKTLRNTGAPDSTTLSAQNKFVALNESYKDFILTYIDTTQSPVVALFALGYSQGIESTLVDKAMGHMTKNFSSHVALNEAIHQYKQQLAQNSKPSGVAESVMAPDITLPDTSGKSFSLSSLRGKYVLVDFWASWCGPCREENPNVVAAYQKFKDKNFTILGVSLDKEKSAWLKAIREDGLSWHHVSDLKYWNSEVVPLYNIEGIPYNVLLDTSGKIIATSLRGRELTSKLGEILR